MRRASVTAPEGGASWNVLGESVTCLLADADAGFSVLEVSVPPGAGPPLHAHAREDEGFYVLTGRFEVVADGERRIVAPGAYAHFPRTCPHTYRNVGDAAGRLLVVISPAGYERFFEAVSSLGDGSAGGPGADELARLATRFDVSILGPPLSAASASA